MSLAHDRAVPGARGRTPGPARWREQQLPPEWFPGAVHLRPRRGAQLVDVDGNVYVDYALGMGANILGHAPATVLEAVRASLGDGQLFAGQHPSEVELALALRDRMPSMELLRFGGSGSEMVACRPPIRQGIHGPQPRDQVRRSLPRLVRRHPGQHGRTLGRARAGWVGARAADEPRPGRTAQHRGPAVE